MGASTIHHPLAVNSSSKMSPGAFRRSRRGEETDRERVGGGEVGRRRNRWGAYLPCCLFAGFHQLYPLRHPCSTWPHTQTHTRACEWCWETSGQEEYSPLYSQQPVRDWLLPMETTPCSGYVLNVNILRQPSAPLTAPPRALIGQEQNPIMAATETDGWRKGARSCNKVFPPLPRRVFCLSKTQSNLFRCACLASHRGASQNEPVSRRPLWHKPPIWWRMLQCRNDRRPQALDKAVKATKSTLLLKSLWVFQRRHGSSGAC